MRYVFAALICAFSSMAGPAQAGAGDDVIASLEALELGVSDAQRDEILQEVTAAREFFKDSAWYDRSAARLVDMARLSKTALRPSARVRLEEMHRQLLEMIIHSDSVALGLASAEDPMLHQFEEGVGMTNRDMAFAVMLEAMRKDLPADPRELQLDRDVAVQMKEKLDAEFHTKSNGQRQFLARVDAWAFGAIAAWDAMSPAERQVAVSVVTEKSIPADQIMMKVIGTTDILFWMAGMDIGLTEEERTAYPELARYLAEGHMAGGVDGLLANRVKVMTQRPSGNLAGNHMGVVGTMMELNYDLLFDNNLGAGGLLGFE